MRPMLPTCFSQVLPRATVVLLGCSLLSAQSSIQSPPGNTPAPAQSDRPQLPDSPLPGNVSSSLQSPESAQPQSSSSAAPWISTASGYGGQVTVPENTLIRVLTDTPLGTRQTREGAPLLFTLSEDVVVGNVLVVPRGATVHGTAVQSKKAGALTGSPDLILRLVSLDLDGRSYPLYSYQLKVQGTSKTQPTEARIKGGALIGALTVGAFSGSANATPTPAGKLAGMGAGAVIGAGLGTAVSAATPGPSVTLPAESQMDFYLASPISVVPVGAEEAARLAQRYPRGGPALYVRGDTP